MTFGVIVYSLNGSKTIAWSEVWSEVWSEFRFIWILKHETNKDMCHGALKVRSGQKSLRKVKKKNKIP